MLTPEEKGKSDGFRKDNPLHRLYFHEIATPDKIQPRLKKLVEWLDEEETQLMHPVDRAARAHFKFMSIYPFAKNSGKVARLLQNLMLLRDGFPPVVIHSIERQRYYDVLRTETAGLVPLVLESRRERRRDLDALLRRARRDEAPPPRELVVRSLRVALIEGARSRPPSIGTASRVTSLHRALLARVLERVLHSNT